MDQDTDCKSFRSTKELFGHLYLLLFISSKPQLPSTTVTASDVEQIEITHQVRQV